MKAMFFSLMSLLVIPTMASAEALTKLATHERPTDTHIQIAISTLYKALNTKSEDSKDRYLALARKKINTRKVEHTYPGAVFVDGVKQFEKGEDSPYDFDRTCFKGDAKDVANLINLALEQNFWSGDEESVQSAKENGKNIKLKIHDGPNNEDFETEIFACR